MFVAEALAHPHHCHPRWKITFPHWLAEAGITPRAPGVAHCPNRPVSHHSGTCTNALPDLCLTAERRPECGTHNAELQGSHKGHNQSTAVLWKGTDSPLAWNYPFKWLPCIQPQDHGCSQCSISHHFLFWTATVKLGRRGMGIFSLFFT